MISITFEELSKAAEPLINILKKEGNPYTKIVINLDRVEILESIMGLPLQCEDD